jgi:hypothetical protein
MAFSFKCKILSFGILWFLSIIILLFSAIFLILIMQGQANSEAVLTKETEELWGYIPGKSQVQIFQKLLFYNLQNPGKILFSNDNITVDEKGPFLAQEYTQMINTIYNESDNSVGFNYWRFLNSSNDEYNNQNQTLIDILNPVKNYF